MLNSKKTIQELEAENEILKERLARYERSGAAANVSVPPSLQRFLREQEILVERYSRVFQLIPSAVSLTTVPDGVVVDVNQKLIDDFGKKKEDVIGKTTLELGIWSSLARRDEYIKTLMEAGKVENFEAEILVTPVNKKLFKITGEILTIEEQMYVLTVLWDITEFRNTERALRESESKYRMLFNNSVIGLCIVSDCFVDANEHVLEMMECTYEEFIGKHPADFAPEFQPDGRDSRAFANESIKAAFGGGKNSFYYQHKSKTGKLIDTQITLAKAKINGEIVLQALMQDITEQKRAERIWQAVYRIAKSVQTNEDLNRLYKTIHTIIQELMPADNFYIALYDREEQTLTYPYFVDEEEESPGTEPFPLGKGLTEYVIRQEKGVIVNRELDLKLRAAGETELIGPCSEIWIGVPLKLSGVVIGVIVVQDYRNETAYGETEFQILSFVSNQIARAIDRKRAEQQLRDYTLALQASKKQIEEKAELLAKVNEDLHRSEAALLRSNADKDKFFSIIAHDLKSPFHVLMNISEILLDDIDELSKDEIHKHVVELFRSTKRVYKLIEDLLQWSRLQTNRIEVVLESEYLISEVVEIRELLKGLAIRKNIDIHIDMPIDLRVTADKNMLRSVIHNLVTNAIKFTPFQGSVTIHARSYEAWVTISVVDTGIGIAPEIVSKLFKVEEHITTKGTADEKGTGLGLILCKEMVEKMGGSIEVKSTLGKGTTFYFTVREAI